MSHGGMDGGEKRIRLDSSPTRGEAEPSSELPPRRFPFRHRIDVEDGRVRRGVSTIAQRIIDGEPPVQAGEECADGEDDDDDDDMDGMNDLSKLDNLSGPHVLMDSEGIRTTREVKRQRTLRLNRNPRTLERLEELMEPEDKRDRLGLWHGTMRDNFLVSLKEIFHPSSFTNWDLEEDVLDAGAELAFDPLASNAAFQKILQKDAKLNPTAFRQMVQKEEAIDRMLQKNPRAIDLTLGKKPKFIDQILQEQQEEISEAPQKKEGKGSWLRRVLRPLLVRCCGRGVVDQVATPDLTQMPEMPSMPDFSSLMDGDDEDEEELDGDDYFQSILQAHEKPSLPKNSSPEPSRRVDQRETLREAGFEFLAAWIAGRQDQRFFGTSIERGPYGRRCRLHGWHTLEINTRIKSLAIQEYWPKLEQQYYIDQNGDVSRMTVPDEVLVLKQLRPSLHPNLIDVMCFRMEPEPAIVMEDTLGGTLDTVLFTSRIWASLPLSDILSLLRDVAKALMYIHEKGLVHGDVRPRTIAVHSNLRVAKLSDFGCTTAAGTPVKGGSAAYLAPEAMSILARPCAKVPVGDARPEQDWYSMAMVVLQMVSGRRFSTAHRKTIMKDDILFQPATQHEQAMKHLDRLGGGKRRNSSRRKQNELNNFSLMLEELNAVYGAMAKKMYPAARYLTCELVWTEKERLLRPNEVCRVLNNLLSMDPRERIPGELLLEFLECEELWERIEEPLMPEEFPETTETPGYRIEELLRKLKTHAKSRNKRGPSWWRKYGRVGHRWWIAPFEDEDFTPTGELNPRYNLDLVSLPFEPWAKKSNISCRV